jgi:hypothetical protein
MLKKIAYEYGSHKVNFAYKGIIEKYEETNISKLFSINENLLWRPNIDVYKIRIETFRNKLQANNLINPVKLKWEH